MKIHTDVRAAYDRWSETYDAQPNATRDLSTLLLQRTLPALDGQVVVEAGCGTGRNSAWLAPRCRLLVGLDASEGMLRVARDRLGGSGVHLVCGDLREPWPLRDEVADLVLINLVLEHIEVLEPVFRAAAVVMRPGALLVVTELHPNRVAGGTRARIGAEGEGDEIVNFPHAFADFVSAARAAGLRLESSAEWPRNLLDGRSEPRDFQPLILALRFSR